MNTRTRDERLRQIYERSAPVVSDTTFARHVKEVTGRRHPKAFKTAHTRRRLVLVARALVSVVVLAVIGVGIAELATIMSKDESVLVMTHDIMSPGIAASRDTTSFGRATLAGVKADLYAEIQRIREGVKSGVLTFEWPTAETGQADLPADPMAMLDSLERSLLRPDLTVYLRDGAGEAIILRTEMAAMFGVAYLEFVSKDDALQRLKETFEDNPEVLSHLQGNPLPASVQVWLTDYTHAETLADQLLTRPEILEVSVPPTLDYAYWLMRLQSLTHPTVGGSGILAPAVE